jgi:hypothetical protein
MGVKKQAISVRVGETDLGNLRKLAKRLGVRDSDVIRVAIKTLLAKWSPLHDVTVKGKNLVPVFIENGSDLFRHFELDTPRLDNIINEGTSESSRVEMEDIQLIAMSGIQRSYLRWRLDSVGSHVRSDFQSSTLTRSDLSNDSSDDSVEESLRKYLYEKYMHTDGLLNK